MGTYALVQIHWGDGLENVLNLAFDDIRTTRWPRKESLYAFTDNTVPVSWREGWDYRLIAQARWMPRWADATFPESRTSWSGPVGVAEFFRWAVEGRTFRYVPNALNTDYYIDNVSLVQPDDYEPGVETADSSYSITIRLSHPTADFGLAHRGLMFEFDPGRNTLDPTAMHFARGTSAKFRKAPGLLGGALGATANANVMRDRHYELGRRTYLSESTRTQLVTDPENFANWTATGTPVLTSGQSDPFAATAAYTIEDNDGAVAEYIRQTVTFTTGVRSFSVFVKKHTAPATHAYIGLEAVAVAWRGLWQLTWDSQNAPVLTKEQGGAGSLYLGSENYGNGWYRLAFKVADIVGTDTNQIMLSPTNNNNASETGVLYIFGVNAWNNLYPLSYQSASGGIRAADDLRCPITWPFQNNFTSLVEVARPQWVDITDSLDQGKFSMIIGTASPRIGCLNYSIASARVMTARIQDGVNDRTASKLVAAGAVLRLCAQFQNLRTAGQVRVDDGTGFGSFSTAANPISTFGGVEPVIMIGTTGVAGEALDSGLIRIRLAPGLHTLNQMMAK